MFQFIEALTRHDIHLRHIVLHGHGVTRRLGVYTSKVSFHYVVVGMMLVKYNSLVP